MSDELRPAARTSTASPTRSSPASAAASGRASPSTPSVTPRSPTRSCDLFPALVEMEGLKPDADGPTGSFAARARAARPTRRCPSGWATTASSARSAAGGMGVVYEAERESLKAHVALKVLHARFRDDRGLPRRFRNEARSAARLHHTNIVSVFDFGEHDGVLYYAMQYIAGHGLDRVLDDVRRLREPTRRRPSAIRRSDLGRGTPHRPLRRRLG